MKGLPVRDVDVALSEISSIRTQLAAATRFLGISPGFNLILGVLAFFVALLQTFELPLAGKGNLSFTVVWAAVILASFVIIAQDAVTRSRQLHGPMARTMLKTALQKILPFAFSGSVISWAVCSFAPGDTWLLPGIWLILIGLLGYSAMSSVPRGLGWVAGWYVLCGAIVLAISGRSGVLTPWMMGVPLTVGHLAVAFILGRSNGEISG